MKRGFGCIIDGAPSIGETACDRADLDDCSTGVAQKRHECLTESDHGEEVGCEDGLYFREVGFDGWYGVI